MLFIQSSLDCYHVLYELFSKILFQCLHSVDPFSKKDWYDVKAPAMFNIRNLGKTLVTRTQGTSKYFFSML